MLSLVIGVVIVALGATILLWTPFVVWVGRLAGRVIHLVKRDVSAESASVALVSARDSVSKSFVHRRTRALTAAAGNRMFDFAALVAALTALGAHARPSQVLMVYAIAQALALIPITPGGLGFVESGMTTLLVLIGVTADQAVVGTLLYRLIAFWLPIPLGALAWAGWRLNLHLSRARSRPARGSELLAAAAGLPAVHLRPLHPDHLGAVCLLLERLVLRDTLRLGVLAIEGLTHLGLHVGEVVVGVVVLSHVSTMPSGRSPVERDPGYWIG